MSAAPSNQPASDFRLLLRITIALGFLCLVAIGTLYFLQRQRAARLPVYATVPTFSLTERSGKTVALPDLRGKVWVADFVFTHCAGPCPLMTARMASLQKSLGPRDDLRLLSFSVDPDRDTPPVLAEYANRFGADQQKWLFLTGDKKAIYDLAEKGFLITAGEVPPPQRQPGEDYIIHSTKFALVDRAGRIRGYYNSEEAGAMEKLRLDIERLLREKSAP